MKVFLIILVSVALLILLTLISLLIVDRIIMNRRLRRVHSGMTGLEIQNETKLKLKVISVEGDFYYARLSSPLRFFRYNLVFKHARLKEVGRI